MEDALALGTRLRSLYGELLADGVGAAVEQQALELRSTPMRRTVETARGVLTGFFGGDDSEDPPIPLALNVDRIGRDWQVPSASSQHASPLCESVRGSSDTASIRCSSRSANTPTRGWWS